MMADLKFAFRMLAKAPGFAATAILTLAIGTGANTAIFSVINALLLKPIFAGVALLLTAIGIYGVMAYSVAQRRQEIGIRMALGAQRSNVLYLIVRSGMQLTAVGVVFGIVAALVLTRLLETLLYGVRPFDPLTLGGVALLLGLIAFLACWLPASRASRANPITALREG